MDEITKKTEEHLKIIRNNADKLAKILQAYFLTKGKSFEDTSKEERENAIFLASIAYSQGYQRGLKEAKGN